LPTVLKTAAAPFLGRHFEWLLQRRLAALGDGLVERRVSGAPDKVRMEVAKRRGHHLLLHTSEARRVTEAIHGGAEAGPPVVAAKSERVLT
jgi:hypothetical protein